MSNPHWCTYCKGHNAHNCQFNEQLPRMHTYTTNHTSPPQRTWVGLTDEDDLDWEAGDSLKDLVKAIEAKLKQKNGYAEEKNT